MFDDEDQLPPVLNPSEINSTHSSSSCSSSSSSSESSNQNECDGELVHQVCDVLMAYDRFNKHFSIDDSGYVQVREIKVHVIYMFC
jgi:hypothetical protein